MKPTKLVIDRAKWLRGKEAEFQSGLRVDVCGEYKMCCLGFYSLACGMTEEQIEGQGYPADALSADEVPEGMEWLVAHNFSTSAEARRLGIKNDDIKIPDSEREKYITKVFARHGVEVEFIGEAESV